MLAGDGTAPEQCTSAVLEHILQQHMDSPSLLAIFPLQVRMLAGSAELVRSFVLGVGGALAGACWGKASLFHDRHAPHPAPPPQDLLPLSPCLPYLAPDEEQINDPTNPRHYWR